MTGLMIDHDKCSNCGICIATAPTCFMQLKNGNITFLKKCPCKSEKECSENILPEVKAALDGCPNKAISIKW